MLIRGLVLLALAGTAGCFGMGVGKTVPGSRPIKRAGGYWADQGNGYERWTGSSGERRAAGRFGGVIAGRFGLGDVRLGDRPAMSNAGSVDLRVEVMFSPHPRFGLGASAAWQTAGASGGGTDVSHSGFPLTLTTTLVPIRPFLLRAGGFVKPSATTVDGLGSTGRSLGVVAGIGVNVQFRGWHFVATVNGEREYGGDVMTPLGVEAYVSDFYLLDIYVIGW